MTAHRISGIWGYLGFIVAAVVLAVPSTFAGVSLRNGNFYIGYKDLVYSGGFEPKIERVYNSKTGYRGAFGAGWGTEYEVHLSVSADGSVVVYEYGGGAENRFTPVDFKRKDLEEAVARIVERAKKIGGLTNAEKVAAYREKLLADSFFRNDEWQKFIAQGELKPRLLRSGTQLISNRFSYQYITKLNAGYRRTFDNGRIEEFNEEGKLAKVLDKNGNFIELAYAKDGKLTKIEDNFHRRILMHYNNQGLISAVEGMNAKEAQYKYSGAGDLTESKDVEGNVYKFAYDKEHNLTEIAYSDGTRLRVAYFGRDKLQSVKSVTDRDGSTTEYDYLSSGPGQARYKVGIRVLSKENKLLSQSSYEYFNKVKASGEEWTQRMVASQDGRVTDTTYNECCGLPTKIIRDRETTLFDYDAKGRVRKKETPSEVTKLAYHPNFGKVVAVEKMSKRTKKVQWSKFEYDAKANLTGAKNSDKKAVVLVYDRNGRINSMLDQSTRRRIDFKYDENSKPIEIIDPKLGSIKVKYNASGEIMNVESDAGRKIAMEVTSSFQNLLDIIRPAGVTLSF